MTESNEAGLDQPFYGPPIPASRTPARESRRSPKHKFDAYSLLCTFTKVATIVLITIGIIVLVLWLVYQPQSIKVFAETASLSAFNLSAAANGSVLDYDLAVNFTFRNPNQKYSVYYQRLLAQASYGSYQIGSVDFQRLHQRRKNTMPVRMVFKGRKAEAAGDASAAQSYGSEKGQGFFHVGVKMFVTVRLKMVVIKSVKFKPDVDCELWIPAPGNATSLAAGFARTECDVTNFS